MAAVQGLEARADTVGQGILQAAQRWPDRTAFIFGDRRASFAEFAAQTLVCARGLLAQGVEPGDHVGILMPNNWAYAILAGATNLVGACAVVLNARYRGEDLEYALSHSDISVLFTSGSARPALDLRALLCDQFPEFAAWRQGEPLAVASAPRLRGLFHFDAPDERSWPTESSFAAAARAVSDGELARRIASVAPEDTALIIFSSGTTARPKACMVSHRALLVTAADIAERLELCADDVLWDPLPFYHLSSHLPLNACRRVGAAYVGQSRFEAADALAEMERVGATIAYPAFPALTSTLIDHPDFKTCNLSRLRLMINIGAPDMLRKFSAAIPQAKQVSCYGLTEGGGISTMSSPHDTLEQRVARTGRPLRHHQVKIVDPDTLEELPRGERGEVVLSGPIFSGYYKDDAQTRNVMCGGNWLRSGDLGWLDEEGQLAFAGRHKDMLKIGGENVSAVEVESFLMKHPKIKMAVVISAPDARLTEVVAAYIGLNAGVTMTEAEVMTHCVGRIASYKVPRYVRFVDSWPMSATKVQKFKLVQAFVPEGKIDVDAWLRSERRPAKPS
ncbi:MAG TPA: AMP-binding protein [Steroidobacteraceae bacterium]|nr:AMP-binding protein [Steroidobacteraceae bacterium]